MTPEPAFTGQTSLKVSPVVTARAVVLGERINTVGLERHDAISTSPLSFRVGEGLVIVFRYGVVVLIGLDPLAEDEALRGVLPRVQGVLERREQEIIQLSTRDDLDEGVGPDGVVRIGSWPPTSCWSSPTPWPRAPPWPRTSARWRGCSTPSNPGRASWPTPAPAPAGGAT